MFRLLLCTGISLADLLPSKIRCQAVIYLNVCLHDLNIDAMEETYRGSSATHC